MRVVNVKSILREASTNDRLIHDLSYVTGKCCGGR